MQETIEQPTTQSEAAGGLTADVLRAEAWAGEPFLQPDENADDVLAPGTAIRRYRFRHPTASGKTIAAAGFVEAARTVGVLILTHRRLLVSQFNRELKAEGYGERLAEAITEGQRPPRSNPITIQTYAWFAR